jgi:hypothetical protein
MSPSGHVWTTPVSQRQTGVAWPSLGRGRERRVSPETYRCCPAQVAKSVEKNSAEQVRCLARLQE